jgi:hypothetical protein
VILRKTLVLLLIVSSLATAPAEAEEWLFSGVVRRQEEKKKSRWSLAEWLKTKERMKWMDQWLALHTPSPFEFYLGTAYEGGNPSPGERYGGWRFTGAAYATIFGVEIQRELSPLNHWMALFCFRIFGYHNQSTNITLHGGVRGQVGAGGLRNPVAGGTANLYFTKFFGGEFLYRYYFEGTAAENGVLSSGHRLEANGFIDYSAVRLQGGYFNAPENYSGRRVSNTGFNAGVKLFF